MADTKLIKTAREKKAILKYLAQRTIPGLSDLARGYRANFGHLLLDPIKQKGALRGSLDYLKSQFVPVSYGKGLARGAALQTRKLNDITKATARNLGMDSKLLRPGNITSVIEDTNRELLPYLTRVSKGTLTNVDDINAYQNLMKQKETLTGLTKQFSGQKQLFRRAHNFRDTGDFNAMKNLYKEMRTGPEKMQAFKDLSRMGGHYLGQGLMTGFGVTMPALAAKSIYDAPEGEKLHAIGSSLGETAGLLAAGPLGLWPSVGASVIGENIGSGVADMISPPSTFRKIVRGMKLPTNVPQYLPRGARYAMGGKSALGFNPGMAQNTQGAMPSQVMNRM